MMSNASKTIISSYNLWFWSEKLHMKHCYIANQGYLIIII